MTDQIARVGMLRQMDLELLVRIIVHRFGHQFGEETGLKENHAVRLYANGG